MMNFKNNSNNKNKALDNLFGRLQNVEGKRRSRKKKPLTSLEIEKKFAMMRHKRIEKLEPLFGNYAICHVDDEMTDEELNYYLEITLQIPPQVRYQLKKKHPTEHPSSWMSRGIKSGYDGKGCNQYRGCVPECQYYAPTGRVEDDVMIREHEERVKRRDLATAELKRKWEIHRQTGRRWNHYLDEGFADIDDDDNNNGEVIGEAR